MGGFTSVQPIPTHGGGFLAGPEPGGGGFARTTYGSAGSKTETGGSLGGSGGGGAYSDLLRRLIEKKLANQDMVKKPNNALRIGKSTNRQRPAHVSRSASEGPARKSPAMEALEARKAADAYEMTRRGAATRPTGLGPGMIPGMAVDPRLLPSSMLPDASGISGSATRVPTGSIASPEYDDDSLYGYSASNPRADALGGLMRQDIGQDSPIDQLTQGRRQWTPPR
jgi:hypothetical protein